MITIPRTNAPHIIHDLKSHEWHRNSTPLSAATYNNLHGTLLARFLAENGDFELWGAAARVADGTPISLGNDNDIVLLLRSTTLAANTALTDNRGNDIIEGTPVTPALAANSLIISNITNGSDILVATSLAGNSRGNIFIRGAESAISFGGANVDGAALILNNLATRTAITSVGAQLHMPAQTQNFDNASSTIAIGSAVFLGIPTYTGDTASLTMTDAATFCIDGVPVASTNVIITNTASALWVRAGRVRLDGARLDINALTMSWPSAMGASGTQLQTDGATPAVLSWAAAGSLRIVKDIHGLGSPRDALDKMLNTQVYRFHYREDVPLPTTGDFKTEYVGIMADEAPWAMHYDGGILNPINTFGYTVLAIQAMEARIKELEERLSTLRA